MSRHLRTPSTPSNALHIPNTEHPSSRRNALLLLQEEEELNFPAEENGCEDFCLLEGKDPPALACQGHQGYVIGYSSLFDH